MSESKSLFEFLRHLLPWWPKKNARSYSDWLDEMEWPYEDDPDWPVA